MKRVTLASSLVIGMLATSLAACGNTPTATPAIQAPTGVAAQSTATPVTQPTASTSVEFELGVSGIGEVKAAQDSDLVFQSQGMVDKVLVKEGDLVKKGDLLAVLDTRSFDQQVHQAQAALDNAIAQQAALTEAPRAVDAAAAAAAVRQAQASLNAVREGAKAPDRAQVQASVSAAEVNLQSTKDKLSLAKTQAETQLVQAVDSLTQAQANFAQAKSNWDTVQDTGNDPITPKISDGKGGTKANKLSEGQRQSYYNAYVQAEAVLHQAEQSVQLAQAAAETARQNEVTGIAAAEQQLAQAQASLDKINLPPDSASLAAAQAALAQAVAARDKLTADPTDSQQAAAAAGIAQAQAALESAQIARERAELRAPFDGVVAAVNIDPGDPSAVAGAAIQVVDVSSLHVDVQVSDLDIVNVKVDQAVSVHADAVPDKIFAGKVSYIAPTATTSGTIRTYLVRVALDEHEGLLAGMSARVDFPAK